STGAGQMKRIPLWTTAALCAAAWAQAPRMPESLTAWPYFKEIAVRPSPSGMLDFVLDREILDRAEADDRGLRLYDSAGKEIPYVLRIRRDIQTQEPFEAREFNRSATDGAVQASYDLGEAPQEHNEVEIATAGTNFRRLADVEGSSDDAH